MVNTRLDGGMGQGRFNLPSSAIVLQAAFSPDMTRIVLVRNAQRSDEAISKSAPAVTGHTIFMWDTRRARWIEGYHTDNALKGTPLAVFSPDGKRLLAHLDKTMMLDPAMGETIPWKAP